MSQSGYAQLRARLKQSARSIATGIAIALDPLIALVSIPVLLVLKAARRIGIHRMKFLDKALLWVGVFPIRDHYYEPLFNPDRIAKSLRVDRALPGLDLDLAGALQLLRQFRYATELRDAMQRQGSCGSDAPRFVMSNDTFESGDADIWYAMIRHFKPATIIEVGSGQSTLMARLAIRANAAEQPGYRCDHVCVEPYENAWLESCGARVERTPVERMPPDFFRRLRANDILFIDSSHVIRPQGDVLFEYLEVLPLLNPGVIVHIHDVFTPRDYLDEWVKRERHFWNEQYLLEAFLSFNSSYKVLMPLNHVHHHAFGELEPACLDYAPEREPGSFYIQRI